VVEWFGAGQKWKVRYVRGLTEPAVRD
jgi:hypothetical protein